MKINAFDFDGVTSIGIIPKKGDIIITGRTQEEYKVVYDFLSSLELKYSIPVFFNPMSLAERGNHTESARKHSGMHKADTLQRLLNGGIEIERFFEDDPIQFEIIKKRLGNTIQLIKIGESVEL